MLIRWISTLGLGALIVAFMATTALANPTGPTTASLTIVKEATPADGTDFAFVRDIPMVEGFGAISTVAGNGTEGSSGDNGPATSAQLNFPNDVVLDSAGNLYISDSMNNSIRKVDATTGAISTVAGTGTPGSSGDNGPATSAQVAFPFGVALDSADNLFIADSNNNRIRKVDAATGIISTVAGIGTPGSSGDGGAATSAQLRSPRGLVLDSVGNLYIADTDNNRIRKVDATTGIISTVAGTGTAGFSGDGGLATNAQLNFPWGLALDSAGNLYLADASNHRIRKLDATTGIISTVAGTGTAGFSGDGGPATSAQLTTPAGVALDSAGNLYISDTLNNRIRKVDATTGIIRTVAGTGTLGFGGDGGLAINAQLSTPHGVALDSAGNLYLADTNNRRIRKVEAGRFRLDHADPDDNDAVAQSITFANLAAGAYTVTELVPTDWVLDGASCTGGADGGNLNGATLAVTLAPSDVVTCTFANIVTHTLTVTKALDPVTDNGLFVMHAGGVTGAEAGNGATVTATVDVGATVYFTETAGAGTDLANYTSGFLCNDASGTNGATTSGSLVMPDADVTCTFTNVRRTHTLTVTKALDPVTDNGLFVMHAGGVTGAEAGNGATVTATVDVGATVYFTETAGAGTDLANYTSGYSCTDGSSGAGTRGSLNMPDADVTCTFTNTRKALPPTVRLVESHLVSRVEEGKVTGEGSVACYWVTLAAAPVTGVVVVNIGPPQNGQVTVNKSSVTLTGTNWNNLSLSEQSNLVCVRPVDDKIDDGGPQICRDGNSDMTGNGTLVPNKECGDHTDSIPHSIGGITASDYTTNTSIQRKQPDGTFAAGADVPVLVQDDDAAGVVLTESHGVSDLDEDGHPVGLACYWVTLTSQPTGEVTVTPQPNSQVTVQPRQVVLNHLTWNALGAESNKICIYPVQDSQVEVTANQSCADKKVDLYGAGAVDTQVCSSHLGAVDHSISSSDPQYNGAGVPVRGNGPDLGNNGAKVIDVLIRDDDVAKLVFRPAALNMLEGGLAQYGIKLGSQPAGTVSVTAQASSVTAAGADATTLTFTPENWNVAQTVGVTLPDDNDVNGMRLGSISHNVSSGDPVYNGLTGAPVTLPLTITDDDSASAALSRGSVAVAEGGAGDSYAVGLTVAPSADVVVTVDGGGQVTASPSQLTFTPANWNVEQTVSITAEDDAVDEGTVANTVIHHTASSSDPAYNGAAIADLLAEVTDNDTAALAVGATTAARIAEGASTTYELALATQPTGPVQVFVVTDGKTNASPTVLTFDASNWTVAQTVTLTGADDEVDNAADVRTSLVNHAAVSADSAYNRLIDSGLSVEIVDNDQAGMRFSTTALNVTANSQARYSVALTSQPSAMVVVEIVPSDGVTVEGGCAAEATEGLRDCLVFTPENWSQPQETTLTVLTDGPAFVDHKAVSGDGQYDSLRVRLSINGAGEADYPVYLPHVAR